MRRASLTLAMIALLATAAPAEATSILFGTPNISGNAYPFGGGAGGFAATRYQQVYSASLFSGPVTITGITFFGTSGDYRANTYTFSLSTSANPVNGLDTTVFANNIGADNAFFGSYALAGAIVNAPINFSGVGFYYDPANGPLLLDITTLVPNTGGFTGFFDAMNGSFGTQSSRAHNYGDQFSSWGLVTQFEVTAVPEPGTLLLLGTGVAAVVARRRLKKRA